MSMSNTQVKRALIALGLGVLAGCGGGVEGSGAGTPGPGQVGPGQVGPGSSPGTGGTGTMTGMTGVAGMTGASGGGGTGMVGPPPPVGACPVPRALTRRLTRDEYNATIADLIGVKSKPADSFPHDEVRDGFNNNAAGQGVSPLLADGYLRTAERLAGEADLSKLSPCPVAAGNDDCARRFVEGFGKRAFRRPLDAKEVTRVLALGAQRKGDGFEATLRVMLQYFLSSPHFLYRLELSPATAGKTSRLSPHETASRLSYFLWGSMPDDALFAAADGNKLGTREEVAAQAERMLGDPRARTRLGDLFDQWLMLDGVTDISRDAARYPGWNDSLLAQMRQETRLFAERVVLDEKGTLESLLTASHTYANKALATYHKHATIPGGASFEKVALDPAKYAGILTQALPLAINAKDDQPSPIYRGRWVREQLLCQHLQPPPPGLAVETPALDPKATTRQKHAQHSASQECAPCHRLIDNVGFAFESFDSTGKWRATDRGLPLDTSGEVLDGGDASGKFANVVELGRLLGKSEQARGCFVSRVFRFAHGRSEEPADMCGVNALAAAFKQSGGNLRSLLVAVTQGEAFLYRTP
jgi:hypothetical protein